jgi:hypothetical protein
MFNKETTFAKKLLNQTSESLAFLNELINSFAQAKGQKKQFQLMPKFKYKV